MELIRADVYDYPKYYDVLFNAEWKQEVGFLEKCFGIYAKCDVRNVFEPACGTGRLLPKLAALGYSVSGNDLNAKAVAYCNARLKKHELPESVVTADMSKYVTSKKQHAAFNLINSFRHLPTEDAAASHLRCIAESLVRGGIYVLGFHLTPQGEALCESESWFAQRGTLAISSNMWIANLDRKKRTEDIVFQLQIETPKRKFRIEDRFVFRTYTNRQINRLFQKVPELELIATHDFGYDASRQTPIDGETEDAIFILRKR
jgi:SAM-dependent methyltransferase